MTVGIGDALRGQGRWQEALTAYQQASPTFQDLGDRRWEAIVTVGIGDALRGQGRWQEALTAYQQASPTFQDLGDRRWERQVAERRAALDSEHPDQRTGEETPK